MWSYVTGTAGPEEPPAHVNTGFLGDLSIEME